jgi:threonine dehydratase
MIQPQDFVDAQRRIAGVAVRTPLLAYPGSAPSNALFLKPENLQPIGAFKIRGAYNAIASLSEAERGRGVIAHSSGNHAQAVAYAARALGVHAVIVMPANAPPIKLEKTREYGAEVVIVGNASSDRAERAVALAQQHGYVPVPPFDDARVIAGQGTAGLEILEDLRGLGLLDPEVGSTTVLVPVSGGGLLAGVATAIKQGLSQYMPGHDAAHIPRIHVIGVEPELAADAYESLQQGHLVSYTAEQVARTVADGLRVQQLGKLNWPLIQAHVDAIITVSEDDIRQAMRALALNAKLVAEPSGAVPFAAWFKHRDKLPAARQTVAVISGGNVEPSLLAEVLTGPH